ncbi:L,D-transpeptidase family protein [Streptomyces sp. NBC_01353]|uniref:L,D-transpeptidase family protein n=1 Tax=Streptomyces sp. NBC_01353 TaxID=2903835 RepID=UPI002E372381|nr:L,D-transpeptidase family protein [Streptomyces sp. NBC_01353]
MPVRKVRPGRGLTAALCATLAVVGYMTVSPEKSTPPAPPRAAAKNAGSGAAAPRPAAPAARPAAPPGLGPATRTRIPDGTRQVFVVTGKTRNTNVAKAVLYERDAAGRWQRAAGPWTAHNALRGWTTDHTVGDLRTPIGVFTLGDAGGLMPDPGALLPYDQDEQFVSPGTGFLGEPLEGSFDYVVAIDYNRVSGTTPLDKERPLGEERGGGVWIHVDHGGPTQGCISLTTDVMRQLLRQLDPAKEPVIVMGPAAEIAR